MPASGPRGRPVVPGEPGVMSVVDWVVMSRLRDRRDGRGGLGFLLPKPWLGVVLGAVARCLSERLGRPVRDPLRGAAQAGSACDATRVTVPVRGVARCGG